MNDEKMPNKFSEIVWSYINGGGESIRTQASVVYGIFNMGIHWLYHGSLTAGLFGALVFLFSIFSAFKGEEFIYEGEAHGYDHERFGSSWQNWEKDLY